MARQSRADGLPAAPISDPRRSPAHGRAETIFALGELLKAHQYAVDAGCDIWDFAVEIEILRRLGLMDTDLRWLVSKNYVEHRRDSTGPSDAGRRFQTAHPLKYHPQSCFVLTSAGVAFATRLFDGKNAELAILPLSLEPTLDRPAPKPSWDALCRQLQVAGHLVKHFRWPAPNQETVLAAFQEDDWSRRIDDPLSPADGQDPKQRLHDTIKCLNRRQQIRLIEFRGDGTGEGVVWQFAPRLAHVLGIDSPDHAAPEKGD